MVRSAKRMLAAMLAIAMIAAFIPVTQENAFAAKAKKPAKVKGVKVTVAKDNKVTITWKKAKNAKKYNVSIKDGATKLTAVKSSKKTKLSFKGGNAVKYTVKVQGVNGKKKGAFSKAVNKKTNDLVKAAQDGAKAAEAELTEAKAALEEAKKSEETTKAELEQAKKDKEAAEARAEAAEKRLADIKAANDVMEAWAEAPDIDVDSAEDDIAEVQAVIDAYDALTDDQKALVSDDVKTEIEAAKAVIAEIEELKAKKAEVIAAIKAATPANYPTDKNTITIDGEEYCVMAVDNDAKEAKLVKKMPVLDSEGNGIPFDANGSYNWKDSSLRAFMNDKETGFFKGRDLLYSMSIEKDNNYSISKVVFEDEPVITKTDYTTKDRAMLLDKTTFNGTRQQGAMKWAEAWNDNTVSTWLYQTTYEDLEDLEGFVELDGDDEYPHLTALYFDDYDYFNDIINIGGWTVNGIARKFGVCPVVYVSIA